jgi:site-specific DNA recombinase
LAHQLLLVDEIEAAGVRIEWLTGARDVTPSGRLLDNIKGVFAEYERERIRERTAKGRRERLRTGKVGFSVPPYGYRVEATGLVPHESEAATVRMMFGWLVQEQRSLRSIAAELQRLGIPTRHGAKWRVSTVRKIIANRIYVGEASFHAAGERLNLVVPALIDTPVWAAAHAQLRRNVETLRGRPAKRFYLLAGLLRCGTCGRRMSGMGGSGRYYECTNRDRVIGNGCATRAHRGRLDAMVWHAVASVLRDPRVLAGRLDARLRRLGASQVEARSEVEHLQAQLAELRAKEDRALALWLDSDLSEDAKTTVKIRLSELASQRRAVADRLAAAEAATAAADADQARNDAVRRYCELAARGLDRLTAQGRQRLLRSCVDAIVVIGRMVDIHGVFPARTALESSAPENVHAGTAS